jgi:Serine-threonine protein kinase 19
VSMAHIQALLNSATSTEREVVELCRKGVVRKIIISGRGGDGEVLILVTELENMIGKSGGLGEEVKERFLGVLRDHPTSVKLDKGLFGDEDAKALMHAGFLTASTPNWTSTEVFSTPGQGSRGTMTSLNSISRAASGSLAAVGGEGAVHAAGGSGGGIRSQGIGDFDVAVPGTGSYLKLVASARAHLLSLLSKSRYREAPESLLKQRWEGGVSVDDKVSEARRNRREFDGVLPGRTRKWKTFFGMGFEWILGECVGAGMVEVFDTGSIGRGVRAL